MVVAHIECLLGRILLKFLPSLEFPNSPAAKPYIYLIQTKVGKANLQQNRAG